MVRHVGLNHGKSVECRLGGNHQAPKNPWTLQWKGEWTCMTQGVFGGVLKPFLRGQVLRVVEMIQNVEIGTY